MDTKVIAKAGMNTECILKMQGISDFFAGIYSFNVRIIVTQHTQLMWGLLLKATNKKMQMIFIYTLDSDHFFNLKFECVDIRLIIVCISCWLECFSASIVGRQGLWV